MNDFSTLNGSVNAGAGQVTLSWSLAQVSAVNGRTVVSNSVQRSPSGSEDWVTLATSTGADFAGATYTDTVPAVGEYQYKLVLVVGIAPGLTTLQSNVVQASTLVSVTLVGSVSNRVVSLDWGGAGNLVGSVGDVDFSTVERSADNGVSYFPIRTIDGTLASAYSETLSSPGTFLYRVKVSVVSPAGADALKVDTVLTSNAVTLVVA